MGRWKLLILPLINPKACLSPSVCQRHMSSGSGSIQGHVEGTPCSQRGFIHADCAGGTVCRIQSTNQMIGIHLHWITGSSPLNPGCPRTGGENIESPKGGPFSPWSVVTVQIEEWTSKINAHFQCIMGNPPGQVALTLTFVIYLYFIQRNDFKYWIETHLESGLVLDVPTSLQTQPPVKTASKLEDDPTRCLCWQAAKAFLKTLIGRLNMLLS